MVWRLYRADPVPAIAPPLALARTLDSATLNSYLLAHPDQPVPGGAFVRASVFRLDRGD
jgi:hypothetical protein